METTQGGEAMKLFKLAVTIVILSGNASLFRLDASSSWTYVGLKGEIINAILPMIGSSPNGIMVGTNTGIWHFEYTWWDHSYSGLPVHDIIKTSDGQLLAAMGNGSDSDGVYIGKIIAIGEPGTRWGFSLLVKCPQPTSLAFQAILGLDTACSGRLYVGNAEGVRAGYLCTTGLDNHPSCGLTAITGAPNPFYITSMIIGSDDSMLYAGGRYDLFPNPGPGPIEYSWLLRGNGSGLTALKKMNVTSIVEMPVQRGPDDGPIRYVAAATIDSGVQFLNSGTLMTRRPSPVASEPIIAIVPFRTFNSMNWNELVAATPSGVFRQCPPNADCVWSKMDVVPGAPRRLAHYQGTTLWTGTDSGVYRYDAPTGIQPQSVSGSSFGKGMLSIRKGKGNIALEINSNYSPNSKVSFFDTRGRSVRTCAIEGRLTTIAKMSRGLYFYRITIDQGAAQTGRVISF
jgi:hypothetical protein